MARIVYRGAYATFPVLALADAGDLAYATDLLVLFEWSGVAWFPYHDYPDYEGQKSNLLTVADWAAIEATDVNFYAYAANRINGQFVTITYAVPVGRTLFITQFSFSGEAVNVADADNNQMVEGFFAIRLGAIFGTLGGNGGGGLTFPKPHVIPATFIFDAHAYNRANHNMNLRIQASGYEV